MIGDGFSPSDFDELSADARAALHGSLQIKAVGAVDDNPRWAAFADERWAELRPEQFNPVMPTAWQIQPDFFSSVDPRASAQLRDIGTFEYDAVMAAGLLACRVAPTGPLPADFGTQFWDAKESLTFEGLSGRVEFDEIGNRKPSSANVQLLNLLNGGIGSDGLATHCPCIDEHPPGSVTLVNGVIKRNLSGVVYDYPSNYGLSSCNSHDAGLSPSCDNLTASGQLDPGQDGVYRDGAMSTRPPARPLPSSPITSRAPISTTAIRRAGRRTFTPSRSSIGGNFRRQAWRSFRMVRGCGRVTAPP